MAKRAVLVGLAALVAGATAIATGAQSKAPKAGEAALGGYCPVAYAEMKQAMKGDRQHKSEYEGHTYYFANAEARKMFDAAPRKYVPAYDGLCATAVSMGKKMASDPMLFVVHDGRTYLFSSADAKAMFEKDRSGVVKKADEQWPTVKQQK